jgi:hypothetical protein
MAENAHSSFAELGLACAEHIVESEILCENKKMASVDHCQKLVQFMWWATKPDNTTMAYRVALTLIAGPKPSIVRWRDISIEEALGRATPAKPNKSSNTEPPCSTASFSEALVGALGSLKETMESIKLKDAKLATEGSKHFARLPEYLQRLLYHLSYVPGEPEPTKLSEEGENFMAQHTLACATTLLKTALRQKYGLRQHSGPSRFRPSPADRTASLGRPIIPRKPQYIPILLPNTRRHCRLGLQTRLASYLHQRKRSRRSRHQEGNGALA